MTWKSKDGLSKDGPTIRRFFFSGIARKSADGEREGPVDRRLKFYRQNDPDGRVMNIPQQICLIFRFGTQTVFRGQQKKKDNETERSLQIKK